MKASQPAIDVAVGDWRQHDGFTNNLNVVVTPTQGAVEDSLGKVARQIKASLTKAAPNYQIRKPTSVAGLPAAHLSGIYRAGRQRYWLEQYVVIGEQQTQVISFSVSLDYPRAQRTKLIGDTLASWATHLK